MLLLAVSTFSSRRSFRAQCVPTVLSLFCCTSIRHLVPLPLHPSYRPLVPVGAAHFPFFCSSWFLILLPLFHRCVVRESEHCFCGAFADKVVECLTCLFALKFRSPYDAYLLALHHDCFSFLAGLRDEQADGEDLTNGIDDNLCQLSA